jgi:hypothetical protein
MIARFFRNRLGQNRSSGQEAGVRGFGRGRSQGGGRGGGTKPGTGPGGNCVCPKCGKTVPHVAGQRCIDQVCPDCGTRMIRG